MFIEDNLKRWLFKYKILQVSGKCGAVEVRVLPAPRGTGIVSGPVAKKILTLGGIKDCFVTVCGETNNQGHLGIYFHIN